jgi:hypothetical protein
MSYVPNHNNRAPPLYDFSWRKSSELPQIVKEHKPREPFKLDALFED